IARLHGPLRSSPGPLGPGDCRHRAPSRDAIVRSDPVENRCAVLTPAGRGAIAVVAVAGPQSVEIVQRCFLSATGRKLAQQPAGRILFGRWGDATGEEIVVA